MKIPRGPRPESTIALLREGYEFIGNGVQNLRRPLFESRILLQCTYCLQGHDAAAMFYESPYLSRINAASRMLIHSRSIHYQAPLLAGMPARNRFPLRFEQRFVPSRIEALG